MIVSVSIVYIVEYIVERLGVTNVVVSVFVVEYVLPGCVNVDIVEYVLPGSVNIDNVEYVVVIVDGGAVIVVKDPEREVVYVEAGKVVVSVSVVDMVEYIVDKMEVTDVETSVVVAKYVLPGCVVVTVILTGLADTFVVV